MRILIHPSDLTAEAHQVSDEVRRALNILSDALIRTEGGGTISGADGVAGVVMLTADREVDQAIGVLAEAGIRASRG